MRLLVGPLQAVGGLCEAHRPSHLVSWVSPLDIAPDIGADWTPENRLLLRSHDIVESMPGLEPPTAEQVGELLAFARGWDGHRPLLVHCWAGVSRSTAAAYTIACQARADVPEFQLARRLRSLSPTATPNRLIVGMADELLGRHGRMSAAIEAIGRGDECEEGVPFELKLS